MKLKQKKCRDFLNATFLEMSKLQTQGKAGAMLIGRFGPRIYLQEI
jgi:hypothetical protein